MPVTLDNAAVLTTSWGGGATGAAAFTVGAGANRCLFVQVCYEGAAIAANNGGTSATYGAQAMTLIQQTVLAGSYIIETWRLLAPTTGTANVVINYTGTVTRIGWGAIAFNGVNQTVPVAGSNSGIQTGVAGASFPSVALAIAHGTYGFMHGMAKYTTTAQGPPSAPLPFSTLDYADGAIGSGGGTVDVLDTFTGANGTDLDSHVGEVGATWTRRNSGAGRFTIDSNMLYMRVQDVSGIVTYTASGVPSSANYKVTVVMKAVAAPSVFSAWRIYARWTDATHFYAAHFNSDGTTNIGRANGGGEANIQSGSNFTWVVGQSYTIEFSLNGSTLTLKVDGVTKATVVDANLGSVGVAGLANTFVDGTTTGAHIDSFQVSPLTIPLDVRHLYCAHGAYDGLTTFASMAANNTANYDYSMALIALNAVEPTQISFDTTTFALAENTDNEQVQESMSPAAVAVALNDFTGQKQMNIATTTYGVALGTWQSHTAHLNPFPGGFTINVPVRRRRQIWPPKSLFPGF